MFAVYVVLRLIVVVCAAATLAFFLIGYRHLKSKGEGRFVRRFVPTSIPSGEPGDSEGQNTLTI